MLRPTEITTISFVHPNGLFRSVVKYNYVHYYAYVHVKRVAIDVLVMSNESITNGMLFISNQRI